MKTVSQFIRAFLLVTAGAAAVALSPLRAEPRVDIGLSVGRGMPTESPMSTRGSARRGDRATAAAPAVTRRKARMNWETVLMDKPWLVYDLPNARDAGRPEEFHGSARQEALAGSAPCIVENAAAGKLDLIHHVSQSKGSMHLLREIHTAKWLVVLTGIGVCAARLLPATGDLQAPVVAADRAEFKLQRPEIYHSGWIDLNKNGVKDIYEDPAQPADARIDDLLRRLSRTERLGQLGQQLLPGANDHAAAALIASGGIGSFLGAAPGAGPRNRLQRIAVEDSRLGIPLIVGFDTIHGFRTVFPIPLGLSCAWDPLDELR